MRPSNAFILFTAAGSVLLSMLLLGLPQQGCPRVQRQALTSVVTRLRLTDLCLFTEARYTRHPAVADLHSPFQDHPLALEHFPSGSLLAPPLRLKRDYAPLP